MNQPAVQLQVYQPKYRRWRPVKHVGIDGLSPRELEVFKMFGAGKTLTGIASLLDISKSTVQCHRDRAMQKLGLQNNLGVLIHFAFARGLVANMFAQEPNG